MASLVAPIPSTGRVLRKPQHSFQIAHVPYQIQPFFLAPVLPGETLKNALLQARVVSDPVKNPIIGWWYEMYLFYVKHRDMPDASHFQNMVLQYGYDLTSVTSAAKAEHYHVGGGVDWVDQCQRAVIPHYFRDGDEAWNVATIGNLPAAKIQQQTWLDSVTRQSVIGTGDTIAGGATAQAADLLLQQYELMRSMKLINGTYEDFLKTYGVRPQLAEDPKKPELVRYVRDWNYPSNTINPADGAPSSALSWAIAERADKDRYFSEPGFLYGVAVARPKVYLSKQKGAAAVLLNDAMSWLPAMLAGNPETSLKRVAAAAGPLAGLSAEDYWVDVRDLLLYGDQFTNVSLAATDAGMVALPTATMGKKYPAAADVDALFKTAASNKVRADGIVSLQILGSQVDHT